jgi:hypothetical protein
MSEEIKGFYWCEKCGTPYSPSPKNGLCWKDDCGGKLVFSPFPEGVRVSGSLTDEEVKEIRKREGLIADPRNDFT